MKVLLLLVTFHTTLAFSQVPSTTPATAPAKASALPAKAPAVPAVPGAPVKAAAPATPGTPTQAAAAKTTPPAPKKELPELSIRMIGMAYPEVQYKTSHTPLAAPDLAKELEKLKLKLSHRLISMQNFRSNPAGIAALGEADAYVIKTYDMNLIPNDGDYSAVMAAEPGDRCFIDTQVLTLRTSGLNRLDQLKGKRIGMLENRGVYGFVMENQLGGKEYLHGDKVVRLFQMLQAKQIDALVTTTFRFGENKMFSQGSVGVWNGVESKTSPDVQAIHTTDRKLPCYVVVMRRNSPPEALFRLVSYARQEPEKAKALMLAIGGFQNLTPILYDEWVALRDKHLRSPSYRDFLAGKVKPPGFRRVK